MEYEEFTIELEDGGLLIINKPKKYTIKNTTEDATKALSKLKQNKLS